MRLLIPLLVASSAFAQDVRRFEVAVSANAETYKGLTEQMGIGASLAWHLHPLLALRASGTWNAITRESAFKRELDGAARFEIESGHTALNVWNALLEVEALPLSGQIHRNVHLGFVVHGGAGVGFTIHQLKPENAAGPATFGETGLRPIGVVGTGVRLIIANRFVVRIDLRDVMFTAGAQTVNGCNRADLDELNKRMELSVRPHEPVSPTCSPKSFVPYDIPTARYLVNEPGDPLLHHVGVQLGFGFLF